MTNDPPSVESVVAFACAEARITRDMAEAELGRSDRFRLTPQMIHETDAAAQADQVFFMPGTPEAYGFDVIRCSRDDWSAPVAILFNLRPFFHDPEPVWHHALPLGLARDASLSDLTAQFGTPTKTGEGECLDWWGCEAFAWRFAPFLWLTVHRSNGAMVVLEYGEPMGLIGSAEDQTT